MQATTSDNWNYGGGCMTLHVTMHAIARYQERVANVTTEAARAALSTPAIEAAANFGARSVRLGTGHRVAIIDGTVTTVLPPGHYARQIQRIGLERFTGNRRKRVEGE